MEYLKLFGTQSEYEEYMTGGEVVLPNVSLIEENMSMGYAPYVPPILTAKYNIGFTDSSTQLLYSKNNFKSMEIDGVMLDEVVTKYTFDTVGEHTVKYELNDETKLGERAFYYCSFLTSVTIPNSVTNIDNQAFSGCTFTSITIPNSVTSIGSMAFVGCNKLTSVTIPNSVISIGERAFAQCSGLTSINVDSGNTVYDSRNNCNAIIKTATNTLVKGCNTTIIPNSVTSIGASAFEFCKGLTNITIPNSITSIGERAFGNCEDLTSITIPDSVISIGNYVFIQCFGLTNVTIGNGVTSIGNKAFGTCTGLTSIVSNATTAPTIQQETFRDIKTGGTLTVPSGSSGYNVWMSTGGQWDYYLGDYGWTKVEQ